MRNAVQNFKKPLTCSATDLTQLRKESMNLKTGQERLSKLKLDRKKSGKKSTPTEQQGTVYNSFYEASIILKTKSDKEIT